MPILCARLEAALAVSSQFERQRHTETWLDVNGGDKLGCLHGRRSIDRG
jgi:hypothetical protein